MMSRSVRIVFITADHMLTYTTTRKKMTNEQEDYRKDGKSNNNTTNCNITNTTSRVVNQRVYFLRLRS